MFKSIFAFIKSIFTSAEDATGILDNAVDFGLLHTDIWVQEAYAESQAKTEKLGINRDEMNAKIKSMRKSQRNQ